LLGIFFVFVFVVCRGGGGREERARGGVWTVGDGEVQRAAPGVWVRDGW
jgi:hypothetical protein